MSEDFYRTRFEGNAAENYERYFVPSIGRPIAEDLICAAGLCPGERVLDVACGTGVVTRLAAERVGERGKVAGLDLNPAMLSVARSVTPTDKIDWYETGAESMPLPDESFDVALSGMGVQFFEDRLGALKETRRVLVPGGRLLFTVPGPTPPQFAAMAEQLGRHVDPDIVPFVHMVFSLNDADELRKLTTDAGFGTVEVRAKTKAIELPSPAEFFWQYVHSTPLAQAVGKASDETRAALERDVCAAWQDFVEDGRLKLQVRMTMVRGEK